MGRVSKLCVGLLTLCVLATAGRNGGEGQTRLLQPAIDVEKLTLGNDADSAPGPSVAVGSLVEWTYQVTNTGSETLFDVFVVDDQAVNVRCPSETLEPGESMSCLGREIATAGQYQNEGIAFGTTVGGVQVSDSDLSHYFGGTLSSSVDLEKHTNGFDADEAPGPVLMVGDPVAWTYIVTNTGTTSLTGITLSDNRGVDVLCPATVLATGESMTCTGQGIAESGQYENIAVVSAFGPGGGAVTDIDVSHYFGETGAQPAMSLELLTEGQDADLPPGPSIDVGERVTWTFEVTNTGSTDLTGLSVFDDSGAVGRCDVTEILIGETVTCTASALAEPGQFANIGSAVAFGPGGEEVGASDPSHYFGVVVDTHIRMEKYTNGVDADFPPGPTVGVGDPVEWTYVITNVSSVNLSSLAVVDDQGVAVSCPQVFELLPGQSMECTGSGTAVAGQYQNLGTVTAETPGGVSVTSDDASHYFGQAFEIDVDIQTATNGEDADNPPGPTVAVGSLVTWTFEVTNLSNVDLSEIEVLLDGGFAVRCPTTTLSPSASMVCSSRAVAELGQHAVLGTVSALGPGGEPATDSDPSHYLGEEEPPEVTIQKLTNGEDADVVPGPTVIEGEPVLWTYEVTNTGPVQLSQIVVTDDQEDLVTCPQNTLLPGESMVCTAMGVAELGQYQNLGLVMGQSPGGIAVSAVDPSHYLGISVPPELDVEKFTNGEDADSAPGPSIQEGDPVQWDFVVTNVGMVDILDIVLTDDVLGTISCPATSLMPSESMTCSLSGTAVFGQHQNIATAAGVGPTGTETSDSDASHYLGTAIPPELAIEKSTNGEDADQTPGPILDVLNDDVEWTYVITNTGMVPVDNIQLIDDIEGAITCPATSLAPAQSMTCTAMGVPLAGQYANNGTVTGAGPHGDLATASDPSHYFGFDADGEGCGKGYWKNHAAAWVPAGYSTTQSVDSVFAQAGLYPKLAVSSLGEAIRFGGGGGVAGAAQNLLRHAVASILNAGHPQVDYPYSEQVVVILVNDALASQDRPTMLALKDHLEDLNEASCPLGR